MPSAVAASQQVNESAAGAKPRPYEALAALGMTVLVYQGWRRDRWPWEASEANWPGVVRPARGCYAKCQVPGTIPGFCEARREQGHVMRINLKLSQQGLILVGVPIGLMLIFLFSLLLLLARAEKEAVEVDRSKTIIAKANSLVKHYYDATSQLIIHNYTRSGQVRTRFEEQLGATDERFKELEELLKNDPTQMTVLTDLQKTSEHGIALLRRYARHKGRTQPLSALEVAILYKQFDLTLGDFTNKLEELISNEHLRHKVSSAEQEKSRFLVKGLIFAGVMLAIALGTALAVLFTRNTTSRLALLMDNTKRLSKKEPLLPRLEGEDEIARLDNFFHTMAADLAEASRKERAILDNAVDVICSISADGHFTAANPATLQVWGHAPDKLVGLHYSEIIAKEDVQKFRNAVEQIREDKIPVNIENRVITPSDTLVHILWALRWSEAEQSLFCVAHNISDRKEVEQMKQDFVATISHELRTPLTSLQATLTLLSEGVYGPLSGPGEKRVKSAESGISRLIMLITDLLDIEKMEAGKLSMNFKDADIADIIERSIDAVQGFAEQQGVRLKPEKRSAKVLADSDRIIQVMVNLMSNAIKFSEDGGQVEIKVADGGNLTEVQIIDHGLGIPAGFEKSIFAKYEQAHSSDSKRRKGTGLGLPICKAIVEQHGGTIGVRNTEGGGSTFWFSIPHVAAAVPAESGSCPPIQATPVLEQ